jgi:hypothetical protein
MMSIKWTADRRLRQSELIQGWRPWEKSTGAKTSEGKAISKMNALKHGGYSADTKRLNQQIMICKHALFNMHQFN